jgi:hypothetical protein
MIKMHVLSTLYSQISVLVKEAFCVALDPKLSRSVHFFPSTKSSNAAAWRVDMISLIHHHHHQTDWAAVEWTMGQNAPILRS